MSRPQEYILFPASKTYIAITLAIAFLLNLQAWGRMPGVPDFVALVLVFWGIHQPRRVGIGLAFCMGLLMDVHSATLFGENALAYTLLAYFAITVHRRVLWFPVTTQAVQIFILMLLTQSVQLFVQYTVSGRTPSWWFFLESIVAAALWPVLTWLMMARPSRSAQKDDARSL
ncbi:MAG: rod shape-determining protein MreD [Oxalobacter sp.]|nr:MAG: rod shape-determining protein MreD [Oxalobacter sp.]